MDNKQEKTLLSAIRLMSVLVLVLCVSRGLEAETKKTVGEDFDAFRKSRLTELQETYQKLSVELSDKTDFQTYADRVEILTDLTDEIIRSFEGARKKVLASMINDVVAMPDSVDSKAFSVTLDASEIYGAYQHWMSQSLPLLDIESAKLESLRTYYMESAKLSGQFIAQRGKVLVDVAPNQAKDVLRLYAVIPFLHTPDNLWSFEHIRQIPDWMQTSEAMPVFEQFALHLRRPKTAYLFSIFITIESSQVAADDTEDPLDQSKFQKYLLKSGKELIRIKQIHAGMYCLQLAVDQMEKQDKQDEKVPFYFELSEIYSKTGNPQMAADQIHKVLTATDDPMHFGKAAMLHLKYLYEAQKMDVILSSAKDFENDEKCAPYKPQIIYIMWVANRRENKSHEVRRLHKYFIEHYGMHPLAADFYFSSAMDSLAASDYEEALRLLEIVIYKFPESRLKSRAIEIQTRIQKVQNEGFGALEK